MRSGELGKNGSRGFSVAQVLIGLLIVIVVAVVAVVALVVPNMNRAAMAANEASARQSLAEIYQAEIQHETAFPEQGYACSLQELTRDMPATPIDANLASGQKNGYSFAISNCEDATGTGHEKRAGFRITAVPVTIGKTGRRGFCMDESGMVTTDASGGTHCSEALP